jgi:NADH-quinone oxidoreductase subunit J
MPALNVDLILFFILAAIAIAAALGMLLSRNAVHSALFLVLNFAVVAVFFLLLGAPFIAMAQVTVYAGAIMVLFLFVIMLLGAEMLRQQETALPWQRPLMVFLGVLFLTALAVAFFSKGTGLEFGSAQLQPDFGGPRAIGGELFRHYLLPFEVTSLLLLVGMIGAVVLTRDERKK